MRSPSVASSPSSIPDVADLPNVCAAAMGVLDAQLHLRWMNPALAERLGQFGRRLEGRALDVLDATPPSLAVAATLAQRERRRVLLRAAHLNGADAGDLVADLVFTPLDAAELLMELVPGATPAASAPRLSESLRGFAHEIKNPLAGVRGAAQLLRRRLDSESMIELADTIIDEADRLAVLADRLLHSSGKPRLARMNIHELLERVAGLVEAESETPRVLRDYDPSLPPLTGDSDRLYQVLLNLVRNAIEAQANTITLRSRVEHSARIGDHGVRVALRIDVFDDGCGVPLEIADSLYKPLVSGRFGGTGLGLALAQETAHEHGGELRHASRPGATVFTLLLPVAE
ncbi:MAG: ATP-binding protein [Rhodanobacteraceae bacterium]